MAKIPKPSVSEKSAHVTGKYSRQNTFIAGLFLLVATILTWLLTKPKRGKDISINNSVTNISKDSNKQIDNSNNLHFKIDSNSGTINNDFSRDKKVTTQNFTSISPKENPLLDVFPINNGEINPLVKPSAKEGVYEFILSVYNVKEDEAYPIMQKFVILKKINNEINVLANIKKRPANTEPIYYSKQHIQKQLTFFSGFRFSNLSMDTLFFCFELEYNNRKKQPQRPVQKIYKFFASKINQSLLEEHPDVSSPIKKYLINNNFW